MMGRRERGQGQLFYEFSLDAVVPPDHLVRRVDAVLDLGWVHKELEPHYSHTGRPSIDPELMIRMLIVGYVFAIRSERRICAEVQVNLAYRWFCRLGIEDAIPNHSAFSRARNERFRESQALRCVFERVVAKCIATGLVGGEAFSIDASLIKADVDKKKRSAGDKPIEWPKAEEASHAVREYLAALDAARSEDDGEDGTGGGNDSGRGGKPPKEVSLTDPQAAWVARKGVDPFFAYDANYLIDNKFGIILDAEGTRANRTDEIAVTGTMIERVDRRFGLTPERLAGDTAYGAARLLKWLWDRGIAPHVPSGISRNRPAAASRRKTFSSIAIGMSTSVRPVQTSRIQGSSIRGAFSPTGRARTIAPSVCSSPNAQQRLPARSRATSTRMCVIRCARWPTPQPSRSLAVNARKWR